MVSVPNKYIGRDPDDRDFRTKTDAHRFAFTLAYSSPGILEVVIHACV